MAGRINRWERARRVYGNMDEQQRADAIRRQGPPGDQNASGRSATATFILVGEGAIVADTTPHTATVKELIRDYAPYFPGVGNNIDEFIRLFCYPDPTGGKQEYVRTRYYNPISTGGVLVFDWTGWVQFVRKLCNQKVVKIHKTAEAADRRAQCILFATSVYRSLFPDIEDDKEDVWLSFLNSYYRWYTGASSAFRGQKLVNPYRALGIINMINKGHQEALALLTKLNKGARAAVVADSQDANRAFYKLYASNHMSLLRYAAAGAAHPIFNGMSSQEWGPIMDRLSNMYDTNTAAYNLTERGKAHPKMSMAQRKASATRTAQRNKLRYAQPLKNRGARAAAAKRAARYPPPDSRGRLYANKAERAAVYRADRQIRKEQKLGRFRGPSKASRAYGGVREGIAEGAIVDPGLQELMYEQYGYAPEITGRRGDYNSRFMAQQAKEEEEEEEDVRDVAAEHLAEEERQAARLGRGVQGEVVMGNTGDVAPGKRRKYG